MSSGDGLGVALVGTGFMGRAHAQAWARLGMVWPDLARANVTVVVGRDSSRTRAAAQAFGVPRWTCRLDDALAMDEVDLVDVCVPGAAHARLATAALAAGKHVLCEKPLANTLAEARTMAAAAERAAARGIRTMVGYNYRRLPAVALARELLAEGRIGAVRHLRLAYLQDWLVDPAFPLTWRLRSEQAGSGALGDLGSHLVDLARYLLGAEPEAVVASQATFVTHRPLAASATGLAAETGAGTGQVDVDDATAGLLRFPGPTLATVEATRFATGAKNALRVECYGEDGAFTFDLERPNELHVVDRRAGSRLEGATRVLVTEAEHPYLSAWWPPGHVLGWEHTFCHQAHDLVGSLAAGKAAAPDFADGARTQAVLEALADSARLARWVQVDQV